MKIDYIKIIPLVNGYLEIIMYDDKILISTYRTSIANGDFPIDTLIDVVRFNKTSLKQEVN